MEDWALIRRLAADGVPKSRIATQLAISRTTIINAVHSDVPPHYERTPGPTSFTDYEQHVRALLAEVPHMPATVLAERVGWTGSIRWFSDNVRRLRPEHLPSIRLIGSPGLPVTRRSAICGSRPGRSRSRTAPRSCCRSCDHGSIFAVRDGTDDPDEEDRGPVAGRVGADAATRPGTAAADLGQRARHRTWPTSR